MQIIDGKKYADEILQELKIKYNNILNYKKRKAKLVVINVGNDEASKLYIKNKENYCKKMGIDVETISLDENILENDIIDIIKSKNNDEKVDAILLQLPLPKHLDQVKISNYIDYKKDVDGITPYNMGQLILNKKSIVPCTAKGIIKLLEKYNIEIIGKDIVIIGRSNIVGKPLSSMLLNRSATVQICHSKTNDIEDKISRADIVISIVGKVNLINKNHKFKDNVCLIDVGINRINGKICGDINYDEVVNNANNKISHITLVPGGVGPMTIACLIENIVEIYEKS